MSNEPKPSELRRVRRPLLVAALALGSILGTVVACGALKERDSGPVSGLASRAPTMRVAWRPPDVQTGSMLPLRKAPVQSVGIATGGTTNFKNDIIFSTGTFVRYPDGTML